MSATPRIRRHSGRRGSHDRAVTEFPLRLSFLPSPTIAPPLAPRITAEPVRRAHEAVTVAPAGAGVLVTGSHRSGTTWVGQILGLAPGLCYLHEPFKPCWDPPYVWTLWNRYFLHVDDHNEAEYEQAVARTLSLCYDPVRVLKCGLTPRRVVRAADQWARWTYRRLRGRRPLVKDPIALFSAPWLYRRFGLDVVMMIRHPAAFVSSIKVKGWWFNFNHFLRQDRLMSELLYPFEHEIRALAAKNDDLVEQAILQWRCFHHVIHRYQQRYPSWQFVRHEDLSLDPLTGFRDMFAALDLRFTPACERAVLESSDGNNLKDAAAAGKSTRFCKLNSAANAQNWRDRLTSDEIRRIRDETADIAQHFYDDAEW